MMRLPHPGSMSVDPATGRLQYQVEDLSIPCRGGLDLKILRYYDSSREHPWNRPQLGWLFSFDERLSFEYRGTLRQLDALERSTTAEIVGFEADTPAPELVAVTVKYPNGAMARYQAAGDGGFSVPPDRRTLSHDPADRTWTLAIPGFGFHRFREDGRLVRVEDAYGNRQLLDWEHVGVESAGVSIPQLVALTDPVGRVLRLRYRTATEDGRTVYFRTVTDWTGRTWEYQGDDLGHVLAFVDPEGNVTRYTYGDPEQPGIPLPPGVSVPNLPGVEPPLTGVGFQGLHGVHFPNGDYVINYPSGARPAAKRVGAQVFGNRLAVNHLYDVAGRRTTRLVGTPENAWLYEFDGDFSLARTVDPLGNEHRYEYDERYRLTTVVNPALGVTRLDYDERGYLSRETDALGRTRSWEYHPTLERVTRVTGPAPELPTVSFEYHEASGALLSQSDFEGSNRFEYNAYGQRVATVGKRGERWSYTYSRVGMLETVRDPLGRVTRYETDPVGRVVAVTTPEGNTTRFAYDRRGLATSRTDPTGAVWRFSYDGNGNLVEFRDPLGNTTRFAYDELNQPTGLTNALGETSTLQHDAWGNLVAREDAAGRRTRSEYDLLGRLVALTDPAGFVTRLQREPYCGSLQVTDPLGRTTEVHRDLACRQTEVHLPDGSVVRTSYDSQDRVQAVTDALGRTTRFAYDLAGRVTEVTDALGQVERRSYDAGGNLVSVTDRRGNRSTFTYDLASRLTGLERRDGTRVAFEYDGDDRLVSVTDARGGRWRFEHDGAGRLRTAFNPLGNRTVRNVHDAAGRLREQLGALEGKVSYEHDALGRVVAVTDPLGQRSWSTHDLRGNLRTLVDPRERAVHLDYDELDRLVTVVDPAGGVVRRVLDAVGNLVSVLDQNGNATYYEFDVMDRVKAEIYPDGTRLEWERDAVGNLVAQRDPRGFRTTFEYDALDRLTRIGYSDEEDATFRYDANGNLVERTDGTGSYTFEHDAEDRVVAFTQPGGSRYRVEYDGEGNRTALVFPDGSRQGLEYDSAGRLAALLTPEGGRTAFTYDAQDRRTRIDRPNGTCTLYEYDEASRLSRLAHLKSSGEKVTPDLRYSRDAVGNVLSITDAGTPLWTYGYDRLDRLVRAVDHPGSRTWEWGYDPMGNRLSESLDGTVTRSSYNELNQLVQMGQTRFWYDLAGNLAHRAGPDGVSTYRFDSRDRLVEVRTPQNRLVRYGYDAVGRLQTRKLDMDTKSTKFEWDGWDLAREVAPDGLETAYHVPQGEILSFKRGSSVFQVHADALGSVRRLTDQSGANSLSTDFDGWGVRLSGTSFEIGFVGSLGVRHDAVTGLIQMRQRWYEAALGRFISRDFVRSSNRYSYAFNRPTVMVDLSGLFPERPELRRIYEQLYNRWQTGTHLKVRKSGVAMGREFNKPIGLSGLCTMLQQISDRVDSNQDFLTLVQALLLGNEALQPFTGQLAMDPSQMQHHAFLPDMGGWAKGWRDASESNQSQTHHLVAFLITGYLYGNTPSKAMAYFMDGPHNAKTVTVNGQPVTVVNWPDVQLGYLGSEYGQLLRVTEGPYTCSEDRKKYRRQWIDSLCNRLSSTPPTTYPSKTNPNP